MRPVAPAALAALGLLTVATVLIAGCAGKSSPSTFASPSHGASTSPAPPTKRSNTNLPTTNVPAADPTNVLPLSGFTATAARQASPVVAVALTGGAAGGSGVQDAETVFVEYSDSVRLLALYQSVTAARVGPVGQTRPADGTILGVTHAIYANGGGPAGFVATLEQSAVSDASITRDGAAYSSSPLGPFTSTDGLRRAVPDAKSSPPLFTFASAGEALAAAAKPARQVIVTVAGRAPSTWTYDPAARSWKTSDPAFAGAAPRSLIFQAVPYKTVQLHHPGGAYVPSARVYGHGAATVVSGPSAATGQWSKTGPEAVSTFGDATGVPVHLVPGTTWVFLVPVGSPVTVT